MDPPCAYDVAQAKKSSARASSNSVAVTLQRELSAALMLIGSVAQPLVQVLDSNDELIRYVLGRLASEKIEVIEQFLRP